MSLIDQPIPNLFGGVSQQPALARFLNQLEVQDNCIADPVEGLRKRPPMEHVNKLIDGQVTEIPAVIPINRDPDNRFEAIVLNGQVRVFDIVTGVEKTVTGGVHPYLNTDTPSASIRGLSVADYTFIVNREKTVGKTADVAPSRPHEGIVFVRAGNYGKTYSISITGTVASSASVTTPRGDVASHIDDIGTDGIAAQLAAGLSGYTTEVIGSVIYISSATPFDIEVEDDQGGQAMKAFAGEVQRFSDLPEKAKEGLVLKVIGDQTSAFDDYWVRFNGKVWEETIEPGLETSLDASTMPHALIRQNDGTFTFGPLPWVDRTVGDDDSAPFPSILDQKISALFYFRNRLGFLADENVVLSQAGDYFNLFATTVTQVLDSDPIDVAAGDNSGENSPVSILEHAVAFDRKLVLFARNAQFIMGADGVLAPNTATVDPVTNFEASPSCRPVSAGRFIYFAFDRDGASGVREFYIDGAAQTEDANEVTAHCPTYLPAGARRMASSTLENVILVQCAPGNEVYAYKYFWSGQEKLQSSWGRWVFDADDDVLGIDFFGNTAYIVLRRPDGIFLNKIRFRPGLTDDGLPYLTLLDRRVTEADCTVTYDAFADETVFTLPYEPPASAEVFTRKSPGDLHAPGDQLNTVSVTGSQVRVAGDRSAYSVVIGVPYTSSFDPTRPYMTSGSPSGGTVANTEAIVKVRDYSLDYTGSGYFKAVFKPLKRSYTVTKVFSGNIMGATVLSVPDLDEGTFRISTPTRNTLWALTIENDSPFPSSFLAASWRGLVESRSRRG